MQNFSLSNLKRLPLRNLQKAVNINDILMFEGGKIDTAKVIAKTAKTFTVITDDGTKYIVNSKGNVKGLLDTVCFKVIITERISDNNIMPNKVLHSSQGF